MDKTNKVILTIVFIIIFYVISWLFLKEFYDNLYSIVIYPLFWILCAIFSRFFIFDNRKHIFEYKKVLIILLISAGLFYIIISFMLGLSISGFANNPYNNSMYGIFLNFWAIGLAVVLGEFVRSSLINANTRISPRLMNFIIISGYVLIAINFNGLTSQLSDISGIFKFAAGTVVPLIILNVLLTNTARYGGPLPAIFYQCIIFLAIWSTPILPDHEWIVSALLSSLVPFLALLAFDNRFKAKEYKMSKNELEETNYKSWVLRFMAIVLTLLFFLGITPIYPINIITNSMYPEINIGDIVIVKKDTIDEVKVGDIIQYQKDSYTVIHRIVKITKKDGIIYLNTKGDNNNNTDKTITTSKNFLGKVIVVVPKVGLPNVWFKDIINQIDNNNATEN